MPIRAILFDVGGPLDTELISERLIDAHMREALAAEGITVADDAFAGANRRAVELFAPNAYHSIIWQLAGRDTGVALRVYGIVAGRSEERRRARGGIELRPGIPALLRRLRDRGLVLGLAANQPAAAIAELDRAGIGRFFTHREVSGVHGLLKPDPRLFLRACADLGVEPGDTIMVGDRIDNDIAPARLLGMRAVLFRTGRHTAQQPRSWLETPDAEVRNVAEMEAALDCLIDRC